MGFGYDQKKIAIPLDHPGDSLFNVGILKNIYDLLFISYRIFCSMVHQDWGYIQGFICWIRYCLLLLYALISLYNYRGVAFALRVANKKLLMALVVVRICHIYFESGPPFSVNSDRLA